MPEYEKDEGRSFLRVPFTSAKLSLTGGFTDAVRKAREMMPSGLSPEERASAVKYFIDMANLRIRSGMDDLVGFIDSLQHRDH